jgi:hypothetical protein
MMSILGTFLALNLAGDAWDDYKDTAVDDPKDVFIAGFMYAIGGMTAALEEERQIIKEASKN